MPGEHLLGAGDTGVTDAPPTATCPSCGACVVLPETTRCGDAVTCPECGATGRVTARLEMPGEDE